MCPLAAQVMLALKAQMLALAEHDVSFLKGVGEADRQLLRLAGSQVAHAAAKLAPLDPTSPDALLRGESSPCARLAGAAVGARELAAVRAAVERLDAKVASLPYDGFVDEGPALLDLRGELQARRVVFHFSCSPSVRSATGVLSSRHKNVWLVCAARRPTADRRHTRARTAAAAGARRPPRRRRAPRTAVRVPVSPWRRVRTIVMP